MNSPLHSPSQHQQQEEGDEHGDEETLKLHNAGDQTPKNLDFSIHQNLQDSGMSPSSTPHFPPPPVSIDYPPPMTDAHVSNHPHPTLTSPSGALLFEGCFYNKRKKGKPNLKKHLFIIRKCETLMAELNPVPFDPPKILYFAKHEGLLKKLGLWDFVHVEFDASVRGDLIAQLVASYDPKLRCSYVNGARIAVNRADLARAFKLPVKKGMSNVAGDGVVSGLKQLSEEEEKDSIVFIEEFLSTWVLLHEDMWMMPNEVLNWTRMIKDGYLEKVDWAGLLWFMVEKELMQGEQLRECYYASHLQHLIKSQHEEVFSLGEIEKLESDVEAKEDECGGNKDDVKLGAVSAVQEGESVPVQGPNIELSLGQGGGDKGGVRDEEIMDVEEGNGDEGNEDEEDEEQRHSDVNHNVGDHFLQWCNMGQSRGLDTNEEIIREGEEIVEESEDEAEDGFDVGPNHDTSGGHGLTGNFLQGLGQMEFTSQQKFGDHASLELLAASSDMQHVNSTSQSYFGNGGKRVLVHEDNMLLHQSLNGSNKRLRIDDQWDLPSDLGTCMVQIQQLMARARMMYEEKENSEEQSKVHQSFLLNEIQKQEELISHLRNTIRKETQKRDEEIFRLEREVYVMGSVVEGYRKSLREIQTSFVEYRQRFQLPEEPVYGDAGPGGIMLSAAEVERQILKQEEEDRQILNQEEEHRQGLNQEEHQQGLKLEEHQQGLKQEEDHLPEEPAYRDAGSGSIMLSAAEIETQRLKHEEEHQLKSGQKVKELAAEYLSLFEGYDEKVRVLGEKLKSHEDGVKQLKELRGNGEVAKI